MGSRDSPLVQKPPSSERSRKGLNSSPYPKVPEAVRTGFLNRSPEISVEISIF